MKIRHRYRYLSSPVEQEAMALSLLLVGLVLIEQEAMALSLLLVGLVLIEQEAMALSLLLVGRRP